MGSRTRQYTANNLLSAVLSLYSPYLAGVAASPSMQRLNDPSARVLLFFDLDAAHSYESLVSSTWQEFLTQLQEIDSFALFSDGTVSSATAAAGAAAAAGGISTAGVFQLDTASQTC